MDKHRGLTGPLLPRIALVLAWSVAFFTPLDAQSTVVRENDIAYAQRGDLVLKLDLARPATGEGPFPAIVYVIDDWAHEDVVLDRKAFESDMQEAAKRGYVGVAFDRRLVISASNNPVKYPFPAAINDAKSAVRWLRSHAAQYRIDPDRIGALGASSGGTWPFSSD